MIGVINFGLGNLGSIINSFEEINANIQIISDPKDLDEESDLRLSFLYDIVDPNNLPENWLESEQFRTLIGDVLVDILDDQVKEGTVQFANTNSED